MGTADLLPIQAKELQKRAENGDRQALEALGKIASCFERWRMRVATERKTRRHAKKLEASAAATFENAVEAGLPTNATADDVSRKLASVEQAWQARVEAEAQAGELNKEASKLVKQAAAALDRAMQEGAQLTLPGME